MPTAPREAESRAVGTGPAGDRGSTTAVQSSDRPLLRVRDLQVRFELESQALEVIDRVSFDLYRDEILCVVGESGSGKTVLMHALLGLLQVEPGVVGGSLEVAFEGEQERNLLADLERNLRMGRRWGRAVVLRRPGWVRQYRSRMQGLLGRSLGLIFQNPRNALDPLMTVGAQILESVLAFQPALTPAQARSEALEWLKRVRINHLEDVFEQYPHQLSGGMCQRVAIAQILALRPRVLIADEPTTGLDATIQASILDLIKEVQREFRLSILLITHDFAVVERLADRIMVLFRGRLQEVGCDEEILRPHARLHPYTGELLRNVRILEGAGNEAQIRAIAARTRSQAPRTSQSHAGCNYVSLCPLVERLEPDARRGCELVPPELAFLSPQHGVRCHHLTALEAEEV